MVRKLALFSTFFLLIGTQRRRLIPTLTLDPTSPVRKPVLSPGMRWVDGPLRPPQRGVAEPFEIKVYEIDDVERLQRRRTAGSKVMFYLHFHFMVSSSVCHVMFALLYCHY